eukprot:9074306-Pyramimonas_sp.AAC.1
MRVREGLQWLEDPPTASAWKHIQASSSLDVAGGNRRRRRRRPRSYSRHPRRLKWSARRPSHSRRPQGPHEGARVPRGAGGWEPEEGASAGCAWGPHEGTT